MADLVGDGLEQWWPAAGGFPFLRGLALLVGLDRDGRTDSVSAQVGPVGVAGVRLVGQDPVRAGAGAARTAPVDPDAFQHGGELRAVTPMPRGHLEGERNAALLDPDMDLRGPATTRASQRVIGWLGPRWSFCCCR
jgi:hypothetical protein